MKSFYEFFLEKRKRYYESINFIGNDFFTAPSLDKAFGEAIAFFLKDYLIKPNIVEIGAGDGKLAFDILNFYKENNTSINYFIVEESSSLIKTQQKVLKDFKNVFWIELKDIRDFEGIILSNEFFDALSISIVENRKELYIDNEKPIFKEISSLTKSFIERYNLEECSKIPIEAIELYEFLSKAFKRGYMLSIDYSSKNKNTIQGYKNNKLVNNIFSEDNFDITHFVEFDILDKISSKLSFKKIFLKKQREFLTENKHFIKVLEELSVSENPLNIERLNRLKTMLISMDNFYIFFQEKF